MKKVEINSETPKLLVCAYGTLRFGHGNYNYILKDRSKFLGTYTTDKNYTMYGKYSGFPVVVPEGDTAIEYDLFEVNSNEVVKKLHSLESCTGIPAHKDNWYDLKKIDTPHGEAWMYVQYHHFDDRAIIESGNWNDRHE